MPGELPINTVTMVSDPRWFQGQLLTRVQLKYALSVQVWPSGHATDSEETIAFTELHDINCMVEEFLLEKANEAYRKFSCPRKHPNTSVNPNNLQRPC